MKKVSGLGKFHLSSEESLKEEALGQICEQALEPQTEESILQVQTVSCSRARRVHETKMFPDGENSIAKTRTSARSSPKSSELILQAIKGH